MFKLVLEKAEEPEIKLPTSAGSSNKQESSRKTSISALLIHQSLWLCGIQQTVENSERDGNTRPPDQPLEKSVCRQEATVRIGHGTTDWFQTGKGVNQGCILSPYLFNLYDEYIMRNSGLDEAQASTRLPGKIPITSDTQMTPSYGRNRRTKEPLDESERGEGKSWRKAQHSEN